MSLLFTAKYSEWYSYSVQYIQDYHEWQKKCSEVMKKQEEIRKKRLFSAAFVAVMSVGRKTYKKRRFWRTPVCAEREFHGFYTAILPSLRLENIGFHNYFRMLATKLEELLHLVIHDLSKEYCIRQPIAAEERLMLTLRYVKKYATLEIIMGKIVGCVYN